MNSVRTDLAWTLPADGGITGEAFATYDWYATTGWSLESHSEVLNIYATQLTAVANAHFLNSRFCALLPTNVYYNDLTVTGKDDGTAVGEWDDMVVEGACSALLTKHVLTHLPA